MSKASNTVTVVDHGAAKVLKAASAKPSIDIGIIGKNAAKKHTGGKAPATLGAIATYQEFGTKTIPARPFISGWFDKNREENIKFIRELSEKLLMGDLATERFMERVGLRSVGGIKKYIASKIPPPLAASTLAKRGNAKRKSRIAKAKAKALANGSTLNPSFGRIKRRKKGAGGASKTVNATPLIDTGMLRSGIDFRVNDYKARLL